MFGVLAQSVPGCAPAPGDVPTWMTVDAAIEVHHMRNENAQNCLAIVGRLDDFAHGFDLTWWGTWGIVGLLFVLIASPMITSAFKRWAD